MITVDHLEERVRDYTLSLEKILQKKKDWKATAKPRLVALLEEIRSRYSIGWTVQQFNWMLYNEAVNITFNALPDNLYAVAREVEDGEFIKGGALVFSQLHNGDVSVFILFPVVDTSRADGGSMDLGTYRPQEITEKLIIEKVDEFLRELIKWEIPTPHDKIGFMS